MYYLLVLEPNFNVIFATFATNSSQILANVTAIHESVALGYYEHTVQAREIILSFLIIALEFIIYYVTLS